MCMMTLLIWRCMKVLDQKIFVAGTHQTANTPLETILVSYVPLRLRGSNMQEWIIVGVELSYSESDEEESSLGLFFLINLPFNTYTFFGVFTPLEINLFDPSFWIKQPLELKTTSLPPSIIWLTLKILCFRPLMSHTSFALVRFSPWLALLLPNIFAGWLPSKTTWLVSVLFKKRNVLLSPYIWCENLLLMYHISSSSLEKMAMPHLPSHSSFFFHMVLGCAFSFF